MTTEVDETRENRLRRERRAGFTLVELLVVMVILGLLAALALPNVFGVSKKARVNIAKTQMSTLGTALDAFALDVGRYPTSQEGLEALVDQPSGVDSWDGPYLKGGRIPKDPWNNAYEYRGPESGYDYEIVSLGADGRAGGDEDSADLSSAQ